MCSKYGVVKSHKITSLSVSLNATDFTFLHSLCSKYGTEKIPEIARACRKSCNSIRFGRDLSITFCGAVSADSPPYFTEAAPRAPRDSDFLHETQLQMKPSHVAGQTYAQCALPPPQTPLLTYVRFTPAPERVLHLNRESPTVP